MNLRFCETTRGKGKIFIHLVGDDLPAAVTLEPCALTREGRPVPAKVLAVPEVEGWVLVLAVLTVSQRVTVVARDASGKEVARAHKTVAALAAKLHSQANTARQNPVTELMRNCDVFRRPQGVFVEMDGLICNPTKGCDVVHGTVSVETRSQEEAEAPLELSFIGHDGQELSLAPWVVMGDSVAGDEVFHRSLSFSVRIPPEVPYLVIWVRSPRTSLADGVMAYEGFYLAGERGKWRDMSLSADLQPEYEDWFRLHNRASLRELELQRGHRFGLEPTFSVVVPLFHTPLDYFHEMVDSVLGQSYGRLQLVLVNASPEDELLAAAIADYERADERVLVVKLDENEGITGNTLRGIDAATGDFVAFFDHDDVIEPDLLYRYAAAINERPDTDLLYCDEDKLQDGHYTSPFLKTDWNPDLLCSENYVCHMLTVRRSIVDEMPREGYLQCEGAQDHFLTLFAGERARNVWHEPRVLYHWRIHAQSTAATGDAKSYTTESGVRAVQAHLDRCGIAAVAAPRGDVPNTYRVDYLLPKHPLVSIIIPNKDMAPVLRRCLASIAGTSTYDNYEVVVVENNSTEEETFRFYEEAQKDRRVRVVRQPSDGTFNFSRTINHGVEQARGDYLLFLNNDTEVISPDWIERMVGHCQRPEVGCVGVKLVYPDGLLQHAGVMIHKMGPDHIGKLLDRDARDYYNILQLTQDLSAVTAACMMMRRETFDRVGRMDEDLAVDYNDTDLCLRLRAEGLLVVYEPLVELTHYESISRGEHNSKKKMMSWSAATGVMMQRWPSYFGVGDPYWHPNFVSNPYRKLFWWEYVHMR